QIVAVAPGPPRVLAVVETQDADHPVGHRAHRDQRAYGQVAGTEVGPGGTAAQAIGQQHAHVGQLERCFSLAVAGRGFARDVLEQALKLAALPGLAVARSGEGVGGPGDRLGPAEDGLGVVSESTAVWTRSTNSANRPARSIAPLSTSSRAS